MQKRPFVFVFGGLVLAVFLFGVALRTAERPFMEYSEQNWNSYWNGMWCGVVTMTTVGFGDFYPSTHLGRLIGIAGCFIGTFLVSLMVLSLTVTLEFTSEEEARFEAHCAAKQPLKQKQAAAHFLRAAIRYMVSTKHSENYTTEEQIAALTNLEDSRHHFSQITRKIKEDERATSLHITLHMLNEKLLVGLKEIRTKCKVFTTLREGLENAQDNQQRLAERVRRLAQLNAQIAQHVQAQPHT